MKTARWAGVVAAGGALLSAFSPLAGGTALAASPPGPRPQVLSVGVSPGRLGATGGPFRVDARATGASTCQLRLVSKEPFAVVYSHNARSCASGHFAARVVVGAPPAPRVRELRFALVARRGAQVSARRFSVALAASPPGRPSVPTSLPATTTVPVPTALPPVPAPPSVTLPPSTSLPTTTSLPATTTVPATTTTTTPFAPVPALASTSYNWSGYAIVGPSSGALTATAVTGTFTVPGLTYAASCNDVMSVWDGVDGAGNAYLVQAGIDLQASPPFGVAASCSSGKFYVVPWWEVITPADMAPQSSIANWDNGAPATVSVGDRVTVTVTEVKAGSWDIELEDDTTGGVFDYFDQFGAYLAYAGPGGSVEWVVEDSDQPANPACTWSPPQSGLDLCPMPAYGPPVDFSGLGYSARGTAGRTYQISMSDQTGNIASVPGALGPNGFSVSYTGAATNAPTGLPRLSTLSSEMAPTGAPASPPATGPGRYGPALARPASPPTGTG